MSARRLGTRAVQALVACALAGATGAACCHTLSAVDGNSEITVDPHTVFGLFDWSTAATDHMFEQWFWFRREGIDTRELSLDTLPLIVEENPSSNSIRLLYSDSASLAVDVVYSLSGGPPGSGGSRIDETIVLTNLATQPLALEWFQETDLDIDGTAGGDFATGGVGGIVQSEGATRAVVFGTPTPAAFQISSSLTLFALLQDGSTTNLDDTGSPFGPGDAAFAFQWSLDIPAGGFVTIRMTKAIPEPITWALAVAGIAGLAVRRCTRSRVA